MTDMGELIHKATMTAYEQGIKTERERIIKLIETHTIEVDEEGWTYCPSCNWEANRGAGFEQHLIALIKGEQK
jgi:hypothetical protein